MPVYLTIVTDVLLIFIALIMLINAIIGTKYVVIEDNIISNNTLIYIMPIKDIILRNRKCPVDYKEAYNYYFNNTENVKMNLWKGKKICIKRFNESENIIFVKNKSCSKNMKNCGKASDKYDFYICINETSKCPINYINISNNMSNCNEKNNMSLKFDEKTCLRFSYKSDEKYKNNYALPILLALGEEWPNNTYEKNLSLINANLSEEYCKNKLDFVNSENFSIQFDSADKLEKNKSYNISLYYRSYSGYNMSCYKENNFQNIINQLPNYQIALLIIELIHLFVLCILISLISLVKFNNLLYHKILIWLKLLIGAIFFISNIVLVEYIYAYLEKIKFIRDNNCTDTKTIESLNIKDDSETININDLCISFNRYLEYFSITYIFIYLIQLLRLEYKKNYRHNKDLSKEQIID